MYALSLLRRWGRTNSAVSARSIYEGAADHGDVNAMHEPDLWYVNGIGGRKDKLAAAQVLREAEQQGLMDLEGKVRHETTVKVDLHFR